ncbi:hypothetical protein AVEN_127378-1 [Araneus ventricosus]|uniref:Uncharacterized protein n=1 Tax=Araneus ventricosus TaxID=182803 RepID=A0A4Y2EV34_ARAVE|nr:hypothetical protein AVEN_127378-1 [Araneus ventricosus]
MKWQKRQRGGEQVIGRMPVVNIQDSESERSEQGFRSKPGRIATGGGLASFSEQEARPPSKSYNPLLQVLEKMNSFDGQDIWTNRTLSYSWRSRNNKPNPFVHYPSLSYGINILLTFQVNTYSIA